MIDTTGRYIIRPVCTVRCTHHSSSATQQRPALIGARAYVCVTHAHPCCHDSTGRNREAGASIGFSRNSATVREGSRSTLTCLVFSFFFWYPIMHETLLLHLKLFACCVSNWQRTLLSLPVSASRVHLSRDTDTRSKTSGMCLH